MSVVVAPDKPWLMQEVIDWLAAIVKSEWTVLETGAGGSTVFFAQRVRRLITYEHDIKWIRKVHQELARLGLPADMFYLQNYPEAGLDLRHVDTIDLALIDGRGRVRSVKDAWPMLNSGGWLLLDDSDRERYAEARELMDAASSARIVFRSGTDETTAWRKR